MASLNEEMKILVRVEAKQAIAELNNLKTTTHGNNAAFGNMSKALIGFGGVTAALYATKKVVIDNIKAGIEYAATIEKQTVAFEVMLKSVSGAQDLMGDIQRFSAATPFMVNQLVDVSRVLVATGTEASEVTRVLENLGNAAMGDSDRLARLADAYSKLQTKGRASLEEINRFTEAGVNILAELETQYGVTREELFEYISAGKVGFDDVNTALRSMTEGEGQFAGMLEKQSETLSGLMSTLKDNMDQLRTAIVSDLGLVGALKDATERLVTWMQRVREAREVAGGDFSVSRQQLQDILGRGPGETRTSDADFLRSVLEDVRGYEGMSFNERSFTSRAFSGLGLGNVGTRAGRTQFIGNIEQLLAQVQTSLSAQLQTGMTSFLTSSIINGGNPNLPSAVGGSGAVASQGNALIWAIENEWWLKPLAETSPRAVQAGSYGIDQTMPGVPYMAPGTGGSRNMANLNPAVTALLAGGSHPLMFANTDPFGTYRIRGAGAQATAQLLASQVGITQARFNPAYTQFQAGLGASSLSSALFNQPQSGGFALPGINLPFNISTGGATSPSGAMAPGELFAFGDESQSLGNQAAHARELAEALQDTNEALFSTFGSEAVSMMRDFGYAMARTGDLGEALGMSISSLIESIAGGASQLLLSMAVAAGPTPAGFALLAAAGIVEFGGGVLSGVSHNMSERAPRASSQSSGATIVVNGDINDADRFEAKVMSVIARSGV